MVGRDNVVGFFGEFMGSVSHDLRFFIDDISGDYPSAVGVTWHLTPRAEGAAVPVQPGLQLLPLPAQPAAAAADPDRVWPGLRGAGDQARGTRAGGGPSDEVDVDSIPCTCGLQD